MFSMCLSVGHLFELGSFHRSFYLYLCLDWNNAFDKCACFR